MKLGDLAREVCLESLRDAGLRIRVGPFVLELETPDRPLAESFHLLYAEHQIVDPGGYADFHVRVVPASGIRRFWRRQAYFLLEENCLFEPYPGHLTFPLLEWGLNYCIARRANQYLIVHSAVLERDGRAVVMPGKPGAGKSTLCAALSLRGWRLLSDEMALLRPETGRVDAIPRPVGLKNESIEIIRRFAPEACIGRIWPETGKGDVAHLRPLPEAVDRGRESAVPAWVVFPTYRPGTAARFAEHPRGGALMRLAGNSLNYSIVGERGFRTLADLVDHGACYEFEYGDLSEAMDAFEQLAEGGAP